MNTHTDPAALAAATPWRMTFSGREIVQWAQLHLGTANAFGGRSGSGTLDAVGHLMAVAASVCQPLMLDDHWCRDGGDLPLTEIALSDATPGDVLVFDMDGAEGWTHGWRWGVGFLVRGRDVDAADAQLCHAWHGHACTLSWLKPFWHRHLVRAHRFARRAD